MQPAVASCARPAEAPESNPFVTVRGRQLEVDGRPFFTTGVNFWAAMNLAVDGPEGDRQRLLLELDHLVELGVTNLRVMASSEGPDSEPYRIKPALLREPGVYDERLLDALDYLLAECGKRDLRLVMVLTNFWEWSGGMAQYVAWHEGTEIPYPAEHVWTEFTAYAARFYDCERCQTWYRDHIRTLITRVNGVNGVTYRDDPTILAWELANEPRLYPQSWIDETAAFIKSLDGDHLVTTGSEGEVGGPFLATHDGEHIDYATVHIWPQNWGWFDPFDATTYENAEKKATEYLRKHVDLAGSLHKPVVLEEFGIARDWSEASSHFSPDAPTTIRDRFFAAMFAEVEQSASGGGPLVGDSLWSWAGRGPTRGSSGGR